MWAFAVILELVSLERAHTVLVCVVHGSWSPRLWAGDGDSCSGCSRAS